MRRISTSCKNLLLSERSKCTKNIVSSYVFSNIANKVLWYDKYYGL